MDILKERTPVKLFLGRMCVRVCVLSQSSVRDKRHEKSKALLIYHFQIHFVCFVLIFPLFLFYWMLPFIFCSNHDMPVQKGRVKLCDGDYTIKKEIGNTCLALSKFNVLHAINELLGVCFYMHTYFCLVRKAKKHIGLFHLNVLIRWPVCWQTISSPSRRVLKYCKTSIEYHTCHKCKHSNTFGGIFILCAGFGEHVRFIAYMIWSQHRAQNNISVTLLPTSSKIYACFSALMFNIFPRLNWNACS